MVKSATDRTCAVPSFVVDDTDRSIILPIVVTQMLNFAVLIYLFVDLLLLVTLSSVPVRNMHRSISFSLPLHPHSTTRAQNIKKQLKHVNYSSNPIRKSDLTTTNQLVKMYNYTGWLLMTIEYKAQLQRAPNSYLMCVSVCVCA